MKFSYQIRTGEYEFINGEVEGTAEEAVSAFHDLRRQFNGGQGVGMKDFARIVHEYCTTGAIQNGGDKDFSANEKLLLGEIKKLVRKDN